MSRAFRMMRADLPDDMTAEQIRDMPMSDFAKLRASVLGDEATTPTRPTVAPVADEPHGHYAEDMPEHMGVPNFKDMGMSEYRAVRNHYIRPTSARGLFD
jgi:hypothetical protein